MVATVRAYLHTAPTPALRLALHARTYWNRRHAPRRQPVSVQHVLRTLCAPEALGASRFAPLRRDPISPIHQHNPLLQPDVPDDEDADEDAAVRRAEQAWQRASADELARLLVHEPTSATDNATQRPERQWVVLLRQTVPTLCEAQRRDGWQLRGPFLSTGPGLAPAAQRRHWRVQGAALPSALAAMRHFFPEWRPPAADDSSLGKWTDASAGYSRVALAAEREWAERTRGPEPEHLAMPYWLLVPPSSSSDAGPQVWPLPAWTPWQLDWPQHQEREPRPAAALRTALLTQLREELVDAGADAVLRAERRRFARAQAGEPESAAAQVPADGRTRQDLKPTIAPRETAAELRMRAAEGAPEPPHPAGLTLSGALLHSALRNSRRLRSLWPVACANEDELLAEYQVADRVRLQHRVGGERTHERVRRVLAAAGHALPTWLFVPKHRALWRQDYEQRPLVWAPVMPTEDEQPQYGRYLAAVNHLDYWERLLEAPRTPAVQRAFKNEPHLERDVRELQDHWQLLTLHMEMFRQYRDDELERPFAQKGVPAGLAVAPVLLYPAVPLGCGSAEQLCEPHVCSAERTLPDLSLVVSYAQLLGGRQESPFQNPQILVLLKNFVKARPYACKRRSTHAILPRQWTQRGYMVRGAPEGGGADRLRQECSRCSCLFVSVRVTHRWCIEWCCGCLRPRCSGCTTTAWRGRISWRAAASTAGCTCSRPTRCGWPGGSRARRFCWCTCCGSLCTTRCSGVSRSSARRCATCTFGIRSRATPRR